MTLFINLLLKVAPIYLFILVKVFNLATLTCVRIVYFFGEILCFIVEYIMCIGGTFVWKRHVSDLTPDFLSTWFW